jgi:UDP-glucose 4-epimerase
MRTAFVTGGSGFVGWHFCQALLASRVEVRCLVRPGSEPRLHPDVVPIRGALDDCRSLRIGLSGADCVYHLAGLAHVVRHSAAVHGPGFHETNVIGTSALAEQMLAAGTPAVLFVSSIAAGSTSVARRLDPSSADYAASKRAGERVLEEFADRSGAAVAVVRPPAVYGPRMKGRPLQLFRAVAHGWPLPVPAQPIHRSMCFVGNLVEAAECAVRAVRGFRCYDVADQETVTTRELIARIGRSLNRSVRVVPVPIFALRAVGHVGDALSRWIDIPITTPAVERLLEPLHVDTTALVAETGYVEPFDMPTALRDTARWLLSQ